jgi:gas vesicle protein
MKQNFKKKLLDIAARLEKNGSDEVKAIGKELRESVSSEENENNEEDDTGGSNPGNKPKPDKP